VEEALEAAVERRDYSVMEKLLEVLSKPYAHTRTYGFLHSTCYCNEKQVKNDCHQIKYEITSADDRHFYYSISTEKGIHHH